MKARFFYIIILLFCGINAYAQDPSFTQAYLDQIYLNPAFTGTNEGFRLHSAYRRQYNGVPGGYSTQNFDADLAEPCYNVGLGLIALNDVEGEGALHSTKFGFTGAWNTTLIKQKLDLAAGGGFGITQKSIEWDKLEFSNQFDPVLGKVLSSSGLTPPSTPYAAFVDVDFGIMAKYLVKIDRFHDALINFGGSIHHLNRPKEAFFGEGRLPALLTLHTGAVITWGSSWKKTGNFLFPYFIYKMQDFSGMHYGRQSEILAGCYGFKDPLFVGITYHNGRLPIVRKNTNELGLLMGYQLPFRNTSHAFQVVYSYEFALTGLSFSTLGTHELSLLIYFDDVRLFCKGFSSKLGAGKCFRDKRSGYIPQI